MCSEFGIRKKIASDHVINRYALRAGVRSKLLTNTTSSCDSLVPQFPQF